MLSLVVKCRRAVFSVFLLLIFVVSATESTLETADGGRYVGELRDGKFHGPGRIEWDAASSYEGNFQEGKFHGHGLLKSRERRYEGEFREGRFSGQGDVKFTSGASYKGEWLAGTYHGKGRLEMNGGEVLEGEFVDGELTGSGVRTNKAGWRSEGQFVKGKLEGSGRIDTGYGLTYEGTFVGGEPSGKVILTSKSGLRYMGGYKQWTYEGDGELKWPNGDVYKGGFKQGSYHGPGTLTYAKAQEDGRLTDSGIWKKGRLEGTPDPEDWRINVETAIYQQRRLLDQALGKLGAREPGRTNLFLLTVAGDGSQEVFRREVEFVRNMFADRFAIGDRVVQLINSRNTVGTQPMATVTSIGEALAMIGSRMDKENDILLVYLTSHGSDKHEFVLAQNNMELRGLPAKDFAKMVKDSGIRWKVLVISACYAGGFIEALKDENTLILTAARHDRRSFGCADENDFTYFGRALFKESLPKAKSFQDAFANSEILIREWELEDMKKAEKVDETEYSLPQMWSGTAIKAKLDAWWRESMKASPTLAAESRDTSTGAPSRP